MNEIQSSKEFLFGKDLVWEDVGPGLRRQIMGYDDKIMLVKVEFKSGQ